MKIASPKLSFWERLYITEVWRGLALTFGQIVKNVFGQSAMPTVQWPEEPKSLPVRHRSRHRLTQREDGSPKCVACMCCETACPASCIHIVAEESPNPGIEKVAKVFEIDLLRCVFCGYCVEACPEDAIRMDTDDVLIVATRREDFIVGMDFLLHGKSFLEHQAPRAARAPSTGEPIAPPVDPDETEWEDGKPIERPQSPAGWRTSSKGV